MKKIMKKVLSLALVIALAIAPMTVMAAPGQATTPTGSGTDAEPYVIQANDTVYQLILAANATVIVQVDDANATINGLACVADAGYSLWRSRFEAPVASAADGTATITLQNSDMFMIVNNADEDNMVIFSATGSGSQGTNVGTMDNPKEVTLGDPYGMGSLMANEYIELAAGNEGYFYKVVAPQDGAIMVSVNANDNDWNEVGWFYYVDNVTAGKYGDYHWSDDVEPVYTEICPVSTGDEVIVFAATYDPNNMWSNPVGNVSVNFGFATVGSYELPDTAVIGENVANIEAGSWGYYYTYTATENGTVTVTMDAANQNGWEYSISNYDANQYGDSNTHNADPVVSSDSVTVSVGETATIMVNTLDPENPWSAPAGTVKFTLTFEAGEGSQGGNPGGSGGELGGGEEDANYEISDTVLQVGDNAVNLSPSFEWTLFEFTPDETGEYKFQTDDGVIGYWGAGTFYVTEPDDATLEGNVAKEVTSVGQSVVVGVKDVWDGDTCNILITKIGDVEGGDSLPVDVYENKVTPEKHDVTLDANKLEGVDVWDEVKDQAVLGQDGYYHLNKEDGPVLFVNLKDSILSLADLANYGAKEGVYDNGVVVSMNDYTQAILDYVAAATQLNDQTVVYPLTEDLMTFYQKLGAYKYWYEADPVMGTQPVVEDAKYPADEAWMFACYYQEGLNTLAAQQNSGAVAPGGTQEAPKTGDNANVAVWAIAMVVAAGAAFVVAESKRRAR